MPYKTIFGNIFHLIFDDYDSAVVLFIGLVNAFSVLIDPIEIWKSIDKIFNILITLFSLLILVRKYKNLKK